MTCDACVSQPLCVWCPQDMSQMNATDATELAKNGMPWGGKCSEGNRHGFNNGEKCEQGIIALHKTGFEKCPAAQKMPDVDGGFSEWSEWSQCQKSGVLGKCSKTRSRKCDNPVPLGRGKPCVGKRQEIKSCSNVECELSPETVEIKNAELNIKAKEIKVDKAENATLMAKEAITRAKGAVNQARLLGNTDKLEEAQDHLQDAEMNLLKAQHDAKEAHFAVDGAKYRLAVAKAFNCRKNPKAVNVAAQSSVTATNCIRATNCGPQLVDGTKDFNGLDWHTADRKRRGAAVTFDFGLSKVYGMTGMNVYNQNSGHGWDVETVQVQKSSDGFKFTNVTVGTLIDSKGAVPNPVNSITFPETKSRFWRLVLNSFYSSDHGEYAGLMEVELLAKVQCETNTSVTDSESLARTDRD